jgi:hypothetical protein
LEFLLLLRDVAVMHLRIGPNGGGLVLRVDALHMLIRDGVLLPGSELLLFLHRLRFWRRLLRIRHVRLCGPNADCERERTAYQYSNEFGHS